MLKQILRKRKPIRNRPRHQLLRLLHDRGIHQTDIAKECGVTSSFVSRVMARRATLRPSEKTEEIWQAIEKALA
jgi:Transcriptional regulators